MVLATALVAVAVAPLTEEFFFRVVLQGWLESLFAERDLKMAASQAIAQSASSPADNELAARARHARGDRTDPRRRDKTFGNADPA